MNDETPRPSGLLALPGEALALLSEAVLALRTTTDLSVAWNVAQANARRALGAFDARLLRVDHRSGALSRFEEAGVETPYLAENSGPVEWVMRHDRALFDEGAGGMQTPRETLLWTAAPAALATLPLIAGSTHHGFVLVAFERARSLEAPERLFLQSLADALALALERVDLCRALDEERARVAQLERRLITSQEASAELLGIVAQEVRSPLSSVKAYAETLGAHLQDPKAPHQHFLDVIGQECDRMAALVGDVHELSRIEGGECTLRLSGVTLSQLAREVGERLADPARRRSVSLVVEIDGDARIEVDAELARRAVENLVLSALQFSPEGARVTLRLGLRADEWTCAVTDDGPPVPAEDLTLVFEHFYRARRSGPTTTQGTRLGLAIARGIVELHGGRLWVERGGGTADDVPVSERFGARFCFAAPVRQMASPRARRVARQTVGRTDLAVLFHAIVEMVAASIDSNIVSLVLVDPDRGDLFVAASLGLEDAVNGRRTTLRSGVAGAVAAWGRPILIKNIETDRRFRRLNHPRYRTKSLLCVPLRVEGEVIGVVNVNNKVNGEAFDEDDLALLAMLNERVGSAIERACAYPDSRRVVEDALEAIQCMTKLKRDFSLGGRRQVKHARMLARELGLSPTDIDVVGYVASIHDVGMVRVEAETSHPGRLDESQLRAVRTHPEVSVEILRPLEYLGVVREIILGHHERWDGTGYPRGIAGDAIPVGSRILAVVDAWESMTCPRPFRTSLTPEAAVAELRREAGRQFDGEVVEAFVRLLERDEEFRAAA